MSAVSSDKARGYMPAIIAAIPQSIWFGSVGLRTQWCFFGVKEKRINCKSLLGEGTVGICMEERQI